MKDFKGKTAVITGAASGIGLGCAKEFARAGMNVALLDIRADQLKGAVAAIEALGVRAIGIETDVSKADSVEAAAAEAERVFGKIHVAMNNAGVFMRGVRVEDMDDAAWNWIVNVNLYGAIHGIQAFLPRIRAHGEGGHVVNTGSIAGLVVGARQSGAYNVTKFGVVALSEALATECADSGIGVSVLCPAGVNTDFYVTSAKFRGSLAGPNQFAATPPDIAEGMHPEEIGQRVLNAIRSGQFFIVTHAETRAWVADRHARLMRDYDATEAFNAKLHSVR